jgi:spermidine/putrescine transport system ATP-binding protein
MNPKSLFIAHFIGESDFLEGYVSSINNSKGLTIELRGGIKVQISNGNFKLGERVILAIRPETFSIKKEVKKGEASIPGVVEKVTFEGANMRYDIRLKNEDLLFIVKPSLTQEWFDTGEKVNVSFPHEKVHVFAYPDRGLKEETSVE